MEDVYVAKHLFTRCFPLSATHSWSRALGLNRTLDGYMSSYLPTQIQNPHLGCIAARYISTPEQNNDYDETAPTTKAENMVLVGALLLEFMKSPKEEDDNRCMLCIVAGRR